MQQDALNQLIKNLPHQPGVYQYYNVEGIILYVGKAKNLKKRVTSYFTKNHENGKTAILVKQIADIKTIVVGSEIEALLLENNLIKKYQPKYNILLKDDKTYPWICIKNERFPRIFTTRNVVKDGSAYFGPYASVKMMNTVLGLIRELYQLRNCNFNLSSENIKNDKFKVCLEYHIGNCKAPCVAKQTEEDYNHSIEEIKSIIKGNINSVTKHLKPLMAEYAETLQFEKAQLLKEKIETLEKYQSKSVVVSPTINDVDVFSIISDEKYGYVNYLKVINGAIIQGHTIELKKKLEETDDELLQIVIANDPCFVGVVGFGGNFNDINTLGQPSFTGPWTNNTLYYVPITFYDTVNNPFTYSYTNTTLPCYEMGSPIAVQYLPQIVSSNPTPNCLDSSFTITITGGLPAINGSQFTASNLVPATASFVNTTANNGGIGAVIGHEFSHGFDDQGSKSDGDGNLNNWWTDEDKANFAERTGKLAAQYDKYEVAEGNKVNGKLTLGENIADIAGITLAYYGLQKAVEKKGKPALIDGFDHNQRFFLGWAQVWHTNAKDEFLINQVKTDPHSPTRYRINGPLVNLTEFHAAFGCKEGQMVAPDSLRVTIW